MSVMIARMWQRRGSTAQWSASNPVLKIGEIGLVTVAEAQSGPGSATWYRCKIGDGTTAWNALPWANVGEGTTLLTAINDAIAAEATARDAAIAAALTGLWDDRGNFDASGGGYPTTGGSGSGGAILKGDVWTVSVAGGAMDVGDTLRALVDAPGSTPANWAIGETNVQQATESLRGTLKVSAQVTVEDNTTTNDVDAVTPKKWWQAWTKGLTLANFFSAVRGTVLTAFDPTPGLVTASDTVESAIGKLVGNVNFNATGIAARALRLITINAQEGTTYTTVGGDGGPDKMLTLTNASAITCTIPPNSSLAYPVGTVINGIQGGAGVVTLTPGGGVTLTSRGGALKTAGTGAFFSALKTATNTWFVTGDLTT